MNEAHRKKNEAQQKKNSSLKRKLEDKEETIKIATRQNSLHKAALKKAKKAKEGLKWPSTVKLLSAQKVPR